jgi:hypothetical protein
MIWSCLKLNILIVLIDFTAYRTMPFPGNRGNVDLISLVGFLFDILVIKTGSSHLNVTIEMQGSIYIII